MDESHYDSKFSFLATKREALLPHAIIEKQQQHSDETHERGVTHQISMGLFTLWLGWVRDCCNFNLNEGKSKVLGSKNTLEYTK